MQYSGRSPAVVNARRIMFIRITNKQTLSHNFTTHPWPPVRNLLVDLFNESAKVHTIHALFEADVFLLMQKLKKKQQEKRQGISINAFIIYSLARSLAENPEMTAMRWGKKKLLIFDEIDILTIVERRIKGQQSIPVGVVIKNAGNKTFDEMNELLRSYQKADITGLPSVKERRKLLSYPAFIRRWMIRRISNDPFLFKKYYGNAAVSSLSISSGNRAWWGIPMTASTLCLMPAGIYKKVVMQDGVPVERDFMSFTFSFNHDVIDGAPASRFARDFMKRFEEGHGLD
jgi:pyruvate/2-oxoglutarate dehydrogenase complex dihydrolipoamide acyltransferase (E2) component